MQRIKRQMRLNGSHPVLAAAGRSAPIAYTHDDQAVKILREIRSESKRTRKATQTCAAILTLWLILAIVYVVLLVMSGS